jgi:flagellar export protein FliJ
MKKFHFPLDRVMDWRRTQTRIEEAKLERLHREIRGIQARQAELDGQRTESEKALHGAASVTGLQLAELDAFQRFSVAENARLERQRTECGQRVAAQIQLVAEKRRDVRLLERLKEQRLKTWNSELGREIDAQADETYLAKWKPVPLQ